MKQPNTTESFEVTYKGDKFDIGNFINRHPGGTEVFKSYKGKDITTAFDHIGHSTDAMSLLQKRKIKSDIDSNNDSASTELNSLANNSTSSEGEFDSKKKFIVKKLFTEEDSYHVHKILGLLALISYSYRYFYVLPTTGNLGINHDILSYLTLTLHMLLSCSSFIFHVLKHRIIENPLIIYEEYRLHAIVFTFRGIFVSLVGLYIDIIPRKYQLITLNIGITLIHLLVDYITHLYGLPGVTAVRITESKRAEDKLVADARYIYSFYQFAALGSHISLDSNLADLGFNGHIAIQSSAFLMTLKRKNLIEWYSHAFWYTFALVLSLYYMYLVKGAEFFLYIFVVFIARTCFNANKYLLWFLYSLSINNGELVIENVNRLKLFLI